MKQENGVGPNYDWAGTVAPEPKPEGLNPSIHCSLTRGIANPAKKSDEELSLTTSLIAANL
jgi:hypothetical protein